MENLAIKESFFVSQLKRIRELGRLANIGEETIKWNQTVKPLMSTLPKGKRYKVVRKMAKLLVSAFVAGKGVNNFDLAKCLKIRLQERFKSPQLDANPSKETYKSNLNIYNQKIENCFRTLKQYWLLLGYDIQSSGNKSRLVKIPL